MIKRHYEKVIIGCCFAFIFANMGITSTGFAVHQPFIVAMDGIGDTGGSLILSTRTLVSLVVMFVVDRYYDLLDVRRGIFIACMLTFFGFLTYSLATSLPVFILGAVILGVGYGFGGMVAATILANRWFTEGVGTAIGIASMGSGCSAIIMPLVVVRVVEAFSLSVAFFVEACVALVIAIVVVVLLRNRPSDIGLEPYAGKPGKKSAREHVAMRPAPKGERGLLLVAMVLVGAYCCGGITYITVLLTSSGFGASFAASIVSIAGFALMMAKLVVGRMFDKWGSVIASAVMFALGAAGFIMLCFVETGFAPLMVAGGALIAIGLSLGTVGVSVWSLETAEPERQTRQIRNFQVAYALGGFIANTLPGIVKDLVGSYLVSYEAMLAILVVSAFIVLRYYLKFAEKPAS